MHPPVEARFEREMGCTPQELMAWIPGASRQAPVEWVADGARIQTPLGLVTLAWSVLPARRIALVVLPRLQVKFDFGAMSAEARGAFMRHFDLYTQRGGG